MEDPAILKNTFGNLSWINIHQIVMLNLVQCMRGNIELLYQ